MQNLMLLAKSLILSTRSGSIATCWLILIIQAFKLYIFVQNYHPVKYTRIHEREISWILETDTVGSLARRSIQIDQTCSGALLLTISIIEVKYILKTMVLVNSKYI